MNLFQLRQILVWIMSAATDAACRSVLIVCMKTRWTGSTTPSAQQQLWIHRLHKRGRMGLACDGIAGTGEAVIESELELRLDRDARRWITRNLAGPNAGAEIWTHVFVVADRVLDIVVIFVPNVPTELEKKSGALREGL